MVDAQSPPQVNQDLDSLHHTLLALNGWLSDKLGTITDAALAQAVVTEMREVVHRIDLVQGLLFTAASDRIAAEVKKVTDASGGLDGALGTATSVTEVVNTMTSFLTLVDTAIDLAKVV
ncbi:hypothetical protein [Telmatospirillum sp.]|uniref:hypothetical protein n=1 Tax=Telmatospirillum sp. TaxID=2079197 RepID=UPI00283AE533|nr:hypothetical protein [Telmatospirillum sp.]MDR3436703.1 hypothetical protein [Telmatospirillum sp.]